MFININTIISLGFVMTINLHRGYVYKDMVCVCVCVLHL